MPYNQNKTNYRTLFAEIKQISIKYSCWLTNGITLFPKFGDEDMKLCNFVYQMHRT